MRGPAGNEVSEREAEVLGLVGEHLTNAEIAARLHISIRTVESHVSSLLRKLDAADRRALAGLAGDAVVRDAGGAGGGNGNGNGGGHRDGPGGAHGGGHGDDGGRTSGAGAGQVATAPVPQAPALPAPLTSFVGRDTERTALAKALGEHRLVSAIGPGGVGKTRLALAVAADLADRYAEGCWYVDLVPVTDPAMIGATVADALGFAEQVRRSPTETVLGRLADAEALLVLDNCEHLIDGVAGLVERLLTACPRVSVLVTSQARLGLPFESTFAVPGLSLDGGDAVALFLDRAAMVGWSPTSGDDQRRIAAICDALDGSALAIELAAARLATRGLDGLEVALGDRMRLLTGGPRLDERHRSLRSALDWSYELLSPTEQAVLRQTSVCASPFTADAAALVVDPGVSGGDRDEVAETLARLADQSLLVVAATAGATRYRMLESIRQYGGEQLAAPGEDLAVHDRHLRWCLATAVALRDGASGAWPAPDAGFAAAADELRAALQWATSVVGSAPRSGEDRQHEMDQRRGRAHELAVVLAELTYARGLANESQRRYEQAAALAADDAAGVALLRRAADVAMSRLAGDDALRLFRAAADIARRAGDDAAAALDLARAAELLDRSPGLLSEVVDRSRAVALLDEARALAVDDPHVAAALITVEAGVGPYGLEPSVEQEVQRALDVAHRIGDTRLESAALDQLSAQQLGRGELQAAAATSIRRTEMLAPLMPRPDLAYELSDALHMASLASIGAGDLGTGIACAQQRYELPFHREDAHLGVNWLVVGHVLAGDIAAALARADEFAAGWRRAGRPALGGFAVTADGAALAEALRGGDAAAGTWRAMGLEMRRNKPPDFPLAYPRVFEAILRLHRGAADEAAADLAADPATLDQWHTGAWRQWYAALRAEATVLADLTAATPEALSRAREIATRNPLASAIVDRAAALAAGRLDDLPAIAATLAPLSRYQQARTLVLAGGDHAVEGRAVLRALGTTPLVAPG